MGVFYLFFQVSSSVILFQWLVQSHVGEQQYTFAFMNVSLYWDWIDDFYHGVKSKAATKFGKSSWFIGIERMKYWMKWSIFFFFCTVAFFFCSQHKVINNTQLTYIFVSVNNQTCASLSLTDTRIEHIFSHINRWMWQWHVLQFLFLFFVLSHPLFSSISFFSSVVNFFKAFHQRGRKTYSTRALSVKKQKFSFENLLFVRQSIVTTREVYCTKKNVII